MMEKVKYEDQTLYHYTSLEVLKNILENRTIRLTDYRFLNDPKEVNYSLDFLKKALPQNSGEYHHNIMREAISNLENGNIRCWEVVGKTDDGIPLIKPFIPQKANLYVLSMTDKKDDLALWTTYGKMGCCIKFNHQVLFEYFDNAMKPLREKGIMNYYRGAVDYTQYQLQSLESFIELKKREGQSLALNIDCEIRQFCTMYKDKAYRHESEYRICMAYPDILIDDKNAKRCFIVKDGYIKPQLELYNFPIEDIFEEIIISPFNIRDCASAGVQEMADWYLKRHINVSASEIKIR